MAINPSKYTEVMFINNEHANINDLYRIIGKCHEDIETIKSVIECLEELIKEKKEEEGEENNDSSDEEEENNDSSDEGEEDGSINFNFNSNNPFIRSVHIVNPKTGKQIRIA
jgi:hypothetical protein